MSRSDLTPSAKVAVVTRTRDRPVFLRRAAASVVGQRYTDRIWVIVNDGGAREPAETAASHARSAGVPVIVIHHQTSHGMEAASNAGIRAAHTDYVAIHDDDDAWDPDFLAKTVALLDREDHYVSVVSHVLEIREVQKNGGLRKRGLHRAYRPRARVIYLADLYVGNLFPPIGHLFRRAAYESAGGFDESFPVLGDWEFNLRLAMEGDIAVIAEPLAYHYVRPMAAAGDPAANTVTAARLHHREQDARFRNALLRKAIRDGHAPAGLLLSIHRLSHIQRIAELGTSGLLRRLLARLLGRA